MSNPPVDRAPHEHDPRAPHARRVGPPLEHAAARRLIDAYLVDELSPADATRLAAHVETCPACAAEIGGATRLLALLGSLPTAPATPDVDERILLAAIRDRDRRHEHRSWLAGLWTQVFRGAMRTTGTLVVAIVTVAFLGGAFVLAAGIFTELAFGPPPRVTVHPDMTPTPAPTLIQTAVPPTTHPAVSSEPTPATTPADTAAPTPAPTEAPTATPTAEPTPTPTPVETATPAPTPEPTAAPTPSPSATAEPTPTPTPAPSPTEKPRRTPPPTASPSPTPTPAPSETPAPTSP